MRRYWLFLPFVATISAALAGPFANQLNSSQMAQLERGAQVVVQEKVEGQPWPRMKIYRIVNVTPEEAAAVFFDFDAAKSFVPNLLKSQISNRVSSTVLDVDYAIDIPIFPDEYYSVRNTLTREAGGYRFDWKLLRAAQTKDTVGCLKIAPYKDRTIFCYENLVTPASAMAPLLRGMAASQMEDTVTAIAAEMERQKISAPDGLARRVDALRAAMAAK